MSYPSLVLDDLSNGQTVTILSISSDTKWKLLLPCQASDWSVASRELLK
jgi:hypothetical protein